MNKDELIRAIANRCHYTLQDTEEFLNALIEIFRESIRNRIRISVRGFGHMNFVTIKSYQGKKPRRGQIGTAEDAFIPETEYVSFKLAKDLRSEIKNKIE